MCELDQPVAKLVYEYLDGFEGQNPDAFPPCSLLATTDANRKPPVMSRICHESRKVALETGHMPIDLDTTRYRRLHDVFYSATIFKHRTWEDHVNGLYHVHWTEAYDTYIAATSGGPLDSLTREASRFSGRASLMMETFDMAYQYPNLSDDSESSEDEEVLEQRQEVARLPLDSEKQHVLDCLGELSAVLVVMRIIVVHCDFETGASTGLFGWFGDAPVQVVDAADEARVGRLFALAVACERAASVVVHQNFHRKPLSVLEREVEDVAIGVYHSEELATVLHPAYMFRLCTQMCNHQKSDSRSVH